MNFFDIADVYEMGKAEEIMGKAIKDLPREMVGYMSRKIDKLVKERVML